MNRNSERTVSWLEMTARRVKSLCIPDKGGTSGKE